MKKKSRALKEKIHVYKMAELSRGGQYKERFVQNIVDTWMNDLIGPDDPNQPCYAVYHSQWSEQMSILIPREGRIRGHKADWAVTMGKEPSDQVKKRKHLIDGDNFVQSIGELKDWRAVERGERVEVRSMCMQIWDRPLWLGPSHHPKTKGGEKLPIILISSREFKARIWLCAFLDDYGEWEDAVFAATGFRSGMWDIVSYDENEDPYEFNMALWKHSIVENPELIVKIHARYMELQGVSRSRIAPSMEEESIINLREAFQNLGIDDDEPSALNEKIQQEPKSLHSKAMSKDELPTNAYRDALTSRLLKDKIVLDIGCGTGVLSMLAFKAGAKKVYAVDSSDIAHYARELVKLNRLADKIFVIQAKDLVEDLVLPEKVDIIVSKWMGFCLFYDSMIDTVIRLRDKWLAKGGIMMPDKASMHLTIVSAITDQGYGFDMSYLRSQALSTAQVDTVNAQQFITDNTVILELDMKTATVADKTFKANFSLLARKNGTIHALVVWFAVDFTKGPNHIRLSTSPNAPKTRWEQTVFYLDGHILIKRDEVLNGTFSCTPGNGNRDLEFVISVDFKGKKDSYKKTQTYKMK